MTSFEHFKIMKPVLKTLQFSVLGIDQTQPKIHCVWTNISQTGAISFFVHPRMKPSQEMGFQIVPFKDLWEFLFAVLKENLQFRGVFRLSLFHSKMSENVFKKILVLDRNFDKILQSLPTN